MPNTYKNTNKPQASSRILNRVDTSMLNSQKALSPNENHHEGCGERDAPSAQIAVPYLNNYEGRGGDFYGRIIGFIGILNEELIM